MRTVVILVLLVPLWWLSIKVAEAIGRHEAVQAAIRDCPDYHDLIKEYDW
jgi:hypothetical protein